MDMLALKSMRVIESPGSFIIHLDRRGEGVREAFHEGCYDLIDRMITESFNLGGRIIPKTDYIEAELLGFGFDIGPAIVIRRLNSLGYRPASVLEFLKLASWHPKLQLAYQILCWSGFDRFSQGLHHALSLDSISVSGRRFRVIGTHDILKGLPALSRVACVKLNRVASGK